MQSIDEHKVVFIATITGVTMDLQKSRVFNLSFLTKRTRGRFKQTADRKNIFQLNWKQEDFLFNFGGPV